MKKLALAAALSLTATSVFAGGMEVPVMEEAPIVADVQAGSSNGGLIIPLLLLLVLAAAVSNNNN